MLSLLLVGVFLSVMVARVESFSTMPSIARNHHFVPSSTIQGRCPSAKFDPTSSALFAAGKKKRRRRKRKAEDAPEAKSSSPESPPSTQSATVDASPVSLPSEPEPEIVNVEGEEINVADIKSVADFSFDGPASIESPEAIDDKAATVMPSIQAEDGAIPLPDIRDTLKRKKMGETPDKGAMEDNMPKTKIDRTDRAALLKVGIFFFIYVLQCFVAVGWSMRYEIIWVCLTCGFLFPVDLLTKSSWNKIPMLMVMTPFSSNKITRPSAHGSGKGQNLSWVSRQDLCKSVTPLGRWWLFWWPLSNILDFRWRISQRLCEGLFRVVSGFFGLFRFLGYVVSRGLFGFKFKSSQSFSMLLRTRNRDNFFFYRTRDNIRHQRPSLRRRFLQGTRTGPVSTYLDCQNSNRWWTSTRSAFAAADHRGGRSCQGPQGQTGAEKHEKVNVC